MNINIVFLNKKPLDRPGTKKRSNTCFKLGD
ncbi:hypothetical protein BCD93_002459 [Clostridium saccharoperbutylacetonicum]|nr:hypothetical protein [Clostridium saccharoperbutylacetonicum]